VQEKGPSMQPEATSEKRSSGFKSGKREGNREREARRGRDFRELTEFERENWG
jgi:hypothetical protein